MLQQGLRLHTDEAGKHGPRWRTHKRVRTEKQPAKQTKAEASQDGVCHERTAENHDKPPAHNCACKGIHDSQVRLGQKKMFHTPPRLSGDQIRGIPKICLDLPCSNRRWVGVGSGAVDGVLYFHAFLPPSSCYCRSALMSRPCHGSMLAFLFPASRDRVEAQFRGTGPVPLRWLAERGGGSP